MLKIFGIINAKISQLEESLAQRLNKNINEPYSSGLFYFGLATRNIALITLELLADLLKFFIILFADSGHGFDILFKQRETKSCPYSYHNYKTVQRKIRVFSSAGLTTIVASVVIVSLLMNIFLAPFLPASAVTYGWVQTDWSGGANASYPGHQGSQPEQNWSKYSSKTATLNASGSLSLNTISGPDASATNTTDVDFDAGQFQTSELGVSGIGTDAQIIACNYDHAGADWTPLDNDGEWHYDEEIEDDVYSGGYDASSTVNVIEIYGNHCNIGTFSIPAGKTILVKPWDGVIGGKLAIYANSVTISGTLEATGKGFRGSPSPQYGTTYLEGPGHPLGNNSNPSPGASYGGIGGPGIVGTGGLTYGSITAPADMGSGAAGTNSTRIGGNGGGAIKIIATSVTVASGGAISANGSNGGIDSGAGSGGSIWLKTSNFSGAGALNANGGNAGSVNGGGGGGGRIAIEYITTSHSGNIFAYGGTASDGTSKAGGAGTIYKKATSQQYGDLIVDNNNKNGTNTPVSLISQDIIFDNITVTKYAKLTNVLNATTSQNINILNNGSFTVDSISAIYLTISSGGVLTHPQGSEVGLKISSTNIDINTGSKIDVSGKGYSGGPVGSNGFGPGRGYYQGGGGSHGGLGGRTSAGTYDNSLNPVLIGSGGAAGSSGGSSGPGGGLVIINTNQLTIYGSILANGGNGSLAGAGSGGSINLTAINFIGTGTISAVGGYSIGTCLGANGSGGGGGMVALNGDGAGWAGITSVLGGSGCSAGSAGTKYFNNTPMAFSGWPSVAKKPSQITNKILGEKIFYEENNSNFYTKETINELSYSRSKIIISRAFVMMKTFLMKTFSTPAASAATFEYTSSAIDSRKDTDFYTVSYATFQFTGQFVTFQFATSSDGTIWSEFFGPAGTAAPADVYATSTNIGGRLNTLADGTGPRYIKYKVFFDNTKEAVLSDITINYTTTIYAPTGNLVSSWYNAKGESNIFGKVSWKEDATLPPNTSVSVQLQTANNNNGGTAEDASDDQPGTATGFIGPDNTGATSFSTNSTCQFDGYQAPCCIKTGPEVTCLFPLNYQLGDGGNYGVEGFESVVSDQWMQYKVFINSGNAQTPTVDEVSLTYVVNTQPQAYLVTTSPTETASGTVTIEYRVNDMDTFLEGAYWPGNVETTLEYRISPASQWQSASLASATTTLDNDPGNEGIHSWSATSTFVWEPRLETDLNDLYTSQVQVRIRVNDREGGNNIGYSSASNPFPLDLKKPVVNQITINASTQVGSQGATIVQSINDDTVTDLLMRISCAVRNDAGGNTILDETKDCTRDWEPYATTTTVYLDNSATAYAIFKDKFGNETDINTISAPPSPDGLMLGDISNPAIEPPMYQLYISWKKIIDIDANFARYVIWRATSPKETTYTTDAGYEQLTFDRYQEISSSSENYIMERNLDTATTYYYKVTMEDTNGNVSRYLSIVQDNPDGQGGTDQTKPDIYFPKVSATTTQTATIVWSTNEPAKSMVQYLTKEQYDLNVANSEVDPFTSAIRVGVNSLSKNENELGLHKIELIGLESNTEYYFKVISEDPAGNSAEISEFNNVQLQFRTKLGPKITPNSVNQHDIRNTSINITWTTNIPADSTVVYSTTTDGNNQLTSPLEIKGSQETVTDHLVGLFGLIPNTTYYYYVKSGVQNVETNEFVETADKNIISTYAEDQVTVIGQETRYYTFKTTYDSQAPIISDPTCEPSITSTSSIQGLIISATTTEPSVVSLRYGLNENNLNTELATTTNYNSDQIITVDNLVSSTTYYFQFTVADEAGNTASSNVFSCKTMVEMMAKEEVEKQLALMVTKEEAQQQAEAAKQAGQASAPGGGMIIIDKTDKVAPILSNIEVTAVTATSARISWVTDEPANGFIKYGKDVNYGDFAGFADLFVDHFFVLKNLEPNTNYHYSVQSADSFGNLSRSENLTFITTDIFLENEVGSSTGPSIEASVSEKINTETMKNVAESMLTLLGQFSKVVSLNTLENHILSQFDALQEFANMIPAPVLSGEPNIDTSPTTATIRWTTDKKANSLVAYTPETLFIKSKNDEAYIQVVGQSKEDVTAHNVKIYNLKPETVYHFQLRSQGNVGPDARSRNFTFKTKPDALEIVSFNSEILSPEKAQFNWLTSLEADTQITYTPYRAGKLSQDELKTISNKALSVNHEMVLNELESGAVYQVELASTDKKGIKVSNIVNFFSTTKDDLPPSIDNIQTESALSQGKDLKVQTAISWTTNEPTACSLKYAKGSTQVETDLTEETMPEASYSRKHALVITKFELGSVYSFRIYCTDSGDNQTISEPHAILTPKQRDSVFDLIINTMEQTFGWIGKLKG